MSNKTYTLQCSECKEELASVELPEAGQDESELVSTIQSQEKLVQCHNCGSRSFQLA